MLGRVKSLIVGEQPKRKILALVLCAVMVSSMLPVSAFAAEDDVTAADGTADITISETAEDENNAGENTSTNNSVVVISEPEAAEEDPGEESAAEDTQQTEAVGISEEPKQEEAENGEGEINPLALNGSGSLVVYVKDSTTGEKYLLSVINAPTNMEISLDSTTISVTDNGTPVEVTLKDNLYYAENEDVDVDDWIPVAYLMLVEDTDNPGSYVLKPYDKDGEELELADDTDARLYLELPVATVSGNVWKIQTNTLCSQDESGNYTQEIIEAEKAFDPVTYVLDGYQDGDTVVLENVITGYDEFYYGSADDASSLQSCTEGMVWEGKLNPIDESGQPVNDVEVYAVYDHLYSFDVDVENVVNEHTEDNGDTYLWFGDTFYIDQYHAQGNNKLEGYTKNGSNRGYRGMWPQLGNLRENLINNEGRDWTVYTEQEIKYSMLVELDDFNENNETALAEGREDRLYGIVGPYRFEEESKPEESTVRVTGRIGDQFVTSEAFGTDTVYLVQKSESVNTDWINLGSHASDLGQRGWFYWINDYYVVNNYHDAVEYVQIKETDDEVRLYADEIGTTGAGAEYDVWGINLYSKRNSEIKQYMLSHQSDLETAGVGFSENVGGADHIQLRVSTTVETVINDEIYNGELTVLYSEELPSVSFVINATGTEGEPFETEGERILEKDTDQETKSATFIDGRYISAADIYDSSKVQITVTVAATGTLYGSNGNEIEYTVDDPLMYTVTLTDDMLREAYDCCPNGEGYDVAINFSDIIKTLNTETLTLYKIWDDNNIAGARDDVTSVTVILQRSKDGEEWEDVPASPSDSSVRKAFTISGTSDSNVWSLELNSEDLDLTYIDGNGETKEYMFRISSEQPLEGVLDGYGYTYITSTGEDGNLTVTNSLTDYPTEVSVEKQWLDGNGEPLSDELIPDTAIVALFQDGQFYEKQTISATGNWTYTFADLPQKTGEDAYEYTVAELDQDGNVIMSTDGEGGFITLDGNVYQVSVSEGTDTDYVISNVYETVNVEGSKTWEDNDDQDGTRPDSITIYLMADSTVIDTVEITPDDDDNWSWSFTDLPKYADGGIEITYRVIEQSNDGYSAEYGYDEENGTYDIVNIHTPDQTSVSVIKDWEDNNNQDGERPNKITVYLYADGEQVMIDEETPLSLTLNEDNNWSGSFDGLDIYHNVEGDDGIEHGVRIEYSVAEDEDEIPSDYVSNIIAIGENSYAFAIVNMHQPETTEIEVHKNWVDQDDQLGMRPDEVTITLTGSYTYQTEEDEEPVTEVCSTQVVTIGEADNWTAVFDDLPVYYEGYEITYTVTEVKVDGYNVSIEGYEITNTLDIPTKSVEIGDTDEGEEPDFDDDGKEVSVGDELTYRIDYHNYEESAATVTITDVLDEGLDFVSASDGGTYDDTTRMITWTLGNIEADAQGYVTFVVTVNDTALVKDEVDNTASVQIGDNEAVDTNPVENPVEEPGDSEKDVNIGDGTETKVGDELIYTITYKNGHSTVADVTITDVLDEGLDFVFATNGGTYDEATRTVTWTISNVAAYTEGNVYLIVKVNENALVYDEVTNTATVQVGDDPDVAVETNEVENPVEDPEDPAKGVEIGNTVEGEEPDYDDSGEEVSVDDELTYKIDYKNGHSEAATVTITDVLDIGLDFVSASDGGTYDEATRTITWVLEDVEAYTAGSVTFTATVNSDAVVKDEVDNTASVKVGDDPAVDTNEVENPVDHPEDPTKGVDVGSGTEVQVGDELTYEITYKNEHSTEATVTITDVLDEGLDYVEGSAGENAVYDEGTRTITWTIEGVEAYAEGSVSFAATVNESALECDEVKNIATVQVGDDPDVAVETNEVENPLDEDEEPVKGVEIGDTKDGEEPDFGDSGKEVTIGKELTYQITYKNGHGEAATVIITDVLDEGLDFVSATNGGTYDAVTRTITWTIENVDAYAEGSVTFTATVNENALEKHEVDNTASVKVGDEDAVDTNTVENPVDVTEKSSNIGPDTEVKVGDTILYEITYINGHEVAADVMITDVLDEGLDFVYATNGGVYDETTHTVTWTIKNVAAYTEGSVSLMVMVNENALEKNEVENTAAVQVGNDPEVETNPIVNPVENPEDPTKRVDVGNGTEVSVGDDLTYTITYKNGHSDTAIVMITDVLDEGLDFVSATDGGTYDEGTRTITWILEDVEAGYDGYVQFTATVNETALVKNEVDNTASVQVGDDPAVDTNEVENPVEEPEPQDPVKSVDTNGDETFTDDGMEVSVGDELTYMITYYNHYSTEATVVITDVLDEGLDFVSATDGGTYDEGTRTITWTLSDVEAEYEGYVTFTATVNDTSLVKDEVDNTASVQIGDNDAVDTNTVVNPVDDPEDPTKDVNIGDGTETKVGDELIYTITYKNDHSTVANVTVTDVLDEGLDFIYASNGGTYDEATRTVTWEIQNVYAYTEGSVSLIVKVNENALVYDEVTNTATVQVGDDPDVAVETNTVENPVEDPEDPAKGVEIGNTVEGEEPDYDDSGEEVSVDDELTYKIDYKNGHSEAATVTITDVLDIGLDFVSASDGGTYDEATRTITWILEGVEAYTAGSVTFTATVNSDAVVKDEVDNTASVQVGDDPAVDTNVVVNPLDDPEDPTKGVDVGNGTEVKVGDELTYVITYKNEHSTEATVTITDVLDEGIDYVEGSAGENAVYDEGTRTITWTIKGVEAYAEGSVSFTATVNESALKYDEVKNIATVQVGDDPDVAVETNEVENPLDENEEPVKSVEIGDTEEGEEPDFDDNEKEVSVGDQLTYKIDYKNGHSEEATVIITDVLDEGLDFVSATDGGTYDAATRTITWTIADVEAYGEGSVTFTVTVNENALEKHEVDNTASVQVGDDPAVDTNTVENPLDETEKPGKSSNIELETEVKVGDTIIYEIDYKNGHSTAADVTITDKLDIGLDFVYATNGGVYDEATHTVTWTLENVAAYAEGSVWLTVTVNETALEKNEVDNTATVQVGHDPEVDTNPVKIPVENPEDPTKRVDVGNGTEVKVGDDLTYTITYKNGHSEAATVTITDMLDEGLDFVSATDGGTYDEGTRTITWILEDVDAETDGYVQFTATVNETALVKSEVDNTATVKVGNDDAVDTNLVENPVEEPEDSEKDVNVGNGTEVNVGDELIYTITYKNVHSTEADITITDVLDAGLDFVFASDNGEYDEATHTVTWTISAVAAHTEGSVTLIVKVNENALEYDKVTNTATVQVGDDPDVAVETNTVENPVEDPEDPAKGVEIGDTEEGEEPDYDDSGKEVSVGDELTYEITYKNGHSEAATVTITDVLDVGLDFVSATDGGTYDEATRTITWILEGVEAYTAGSVTFTATVNSDAVVKDEVDNTASVQVGDDPAVDTNVVENPLDDPEDPIKGVDVGDGTEVKVGDELTYAITYKNEHSTEATVTITDVLDEGLDFVSATDGGIYDEGTRTITWTLEGVEAYASGSVSIVATVNETALVYDEVKNKATVQVGDDPDIAVETNEVENPLDEDEEPVKGVEIGDTKDGEEPDFDDSGKEVTIGKELTYQITYKNGHGEEATVIITDVLDEGLDFVSATDGGTYDAATRTITWTIENVEAYGEGSVTFTATVNENALEKHEIDNTASVQVGDDPAVDTNKVENPLEDPEMPDKTAYVEPGTEVKVGDTIIYEIDYKNGHSTAADVTITDKLDIGLDFVYATNGGVYDEATHTVTWTLDNVAAYAKGSVSLVVTVNENALVKDEVENTATVQFDNQNEQETNPITHPVEDPEDPTKGVDTDQNHEFEDDGKEVSVGDELTYKITYKNPHSTEATITITDVLDESLDFISATDNGVYDEETRTITWTLEGVEPYAEGSVSFTATVNSDAREKEEVDNIASVQVGNEAAQETNKVENPLESEYVKLTIEKEVVGKSDTTEYEFEITLTKDGEGYTGDIDTTDADTANPIAQIGQWFSGIIRMLAGDEDESIPFENGVGTVTVTAGESVTLLIPSGWDVTVTEKTTGADSTTVYDGDGNVIVQAKGKTTEAVAYLGTIADSTQVKFVNSYRSYFPIDEEIVTDEEDIFDRDAWVKEESVNEYNAIEIEMTTNLPVVTAYDLENGAFTMNFHEVLDHELVLDENTADFSVYIGEQSISTAYYRITFDDDTGDDCNFHVDVDLTALYNDGIVTEDMLDGNTEITIFFFADLEGTGLNGSYTSTVWYDIYDGDEWLYTSDESVIEVYTYEIEIVKYDITDENLKLEGATFGIYYDENCTEPVSRNGDAYTEVSDEDGVVMFYGLAEGTYYVKELEAPDGYQLSDEVLTIELSEETVDEEHIYHETFADVPEEEPEEPGNYEKDVNIGDGTETKVGDELIYTITYKNDHSTVENVTVTDVLDEGLDFVYASNSGTYDEATRTVTWEIQNVYAYTEGSVSLIVIVNENALVYDEVTNTATVQVGDDPDVAVETNTVENPVEDPEDPAKGVEIGDTEEGEEPDYNDSGEEVSVDDELTYKIDYKNGHSEAATVTITDVLDAGLTYVEGSASDGGTYDEATRTITWILEGVEAYGEGSVTFTATVNSDAVVKDEVDNTASVKVGDDPAVDTNEVENPVDHPEDPTKGVDVGSGTEVKVGDDLTYVITYKNEHSTEATVTITDVLDEGLDYVEGSAGENAVYDEETRTITWTIEEVEAYAGGSVSFIATVNETALVKNEVDNTASVQIDNEEAADTNTVENPLDETEEPVKSVEIGDTEEEPDFEDNGKEISVGDTLTYKVDYKNGHDEEATVIITDVLDEGLDFVSASDDGIYDEATHTITWTIENIAAYTEGSVWLMVTVNENALEKNVVENTAAVQVGDEPAVDTNTVKNPVPEEPENPPEPDEPQNPVKSVDVGDGTGVQAGDELTYTITYYNHNAEEATVTITDTLDEALDFVSATEDGTYDEESRTVTWTIEDAAAQKEGAVSVTVKVNDKAMAGTEIENTADVRIGNDEAVTTNTVKNPIPELITEPGPATENPTGTTGTNGSPKTGDTNNIALWLALLMAGLAGVLGASRMKKGTRKQR